MSNELTQSQQKMLDTWIRKATCGFVRKTKIDPIREAAQNAFWEHIEDRCPDRAPTDDDCKAVLKSLGNPYEFGANFLSDRHWLINPAYYNHVRNMEGMLLSYAVPIILALFLIIQAFIAAAPVLGLNIFVFSAPINVTIFFLTMGSLLWCFCYLIAAFLYIPRKDISNVIALDFSAANFVTKHNRFTLPTSGTGYMLVKLLVTLLPLIVPAMYASPNNLYFLTIAVFFFAAIRIEILVRRIHQRRMPTYLTRLGVDAAILLTITTIYTQLDRLANSSAVRSTQSRFFGTSNELSLFTLLIFFIYIICDISIAISRLHYCHRQTVRTEHPAIMDYVNTYSHSVPDSEREYIKITVHNRILDCLTEIGASHNPDDETLTLVLEELGHPYNVFGAYVTSRSLVHKKAVMLCMAFNKLLCLIAIPALLFCLWMAFTGNFFFLSVDNSIVSTLMLTVGCPILLNLSLFRNSYRILTYIDQHHKF